MLCSRRCHPALNTYGKLRSSIKQMREISSPQGKEHCRGVDRLGLIWAGRFAMYIRQIECPCDNGMGRIIQRDFASKLQFFPFYCEAIHATDQFDLRDNVIFFQVQHPTSVA